MFRTRRRAFYAFNEFRGFHLRFRDVVHGRIRILTLRNKSAHLKAGMGQNERMTELNVGV
jgi:NAD-specific glutamate dehydrogenase